MVDGEASLRWFDDDESWYTARLIGDEPPGIRRWSGDSDEAIEDQRVEVLFTQSARTSSDVNLIHDTISGAVFELWMDQPCGGGCRCAVAIVWRPDVPVPA
jgi:hypothetical protein